MQKWEYMIVRSFSVREVVAVNGESLKPRQSLIGFLAKAGTEGWELTAATENENDSHYLFFKRPAKQE